MLNKLILYLYLTKYLLIISMFFIYSLVKVRLINVKIFNETLLLTIVIFRTF